MRDVIKQPPTCPCCGNFDQVYKVSLLYLEASSRQNRHELADQPELEAVLADLLPEESTQAEQNQLVANQVKALEPPSGTRRVSRRIHPDWLIFFVTAVGLVIAYQSATSRPEDVPVIVSLLSASLLVYLLVRRPVMLRFETQNRSELEERKRVERAVSRWMRLYFCSRDQIVFDPDENRFAPLEQFEELLNRT